MQRDQSTIKYITSVMDGKCAVNAANGNDIAALRQAYPYLVPVRYVAAFHTQELSAFSPAMLSGVQPYLGDWIVFCDFLQKPRALQSPVSILEVPVVEMPVIETVKEIISPAANEEHFVVAEILPAELAQMKDIVVPMKVEATVVEVASVVLNQGADAAEIVQGTLVSKEDIQPVLQESIKADLPADLIMPVFSQDYFLHNGEKVAEEITFKLDELKKPQPDNEADKALMVVMSFSEWLLHFKNSSHRQEEETKDQKALKTMWQKEKLAAAMEEENEEIPENVFEMAVNSISKEDGVASETLATIYIKQGKHDLAIEMYRKLSLRNPQKNAYFARKIEEALKDKQT
jgi:hypothetical protein